MIQPETLASAAEPTQDQRSTVSVLTPLSFARRSDCEHAFQLRPAAVNCMMKNTVPIASSGGDHRNELHDADLHRKAAVENPERRAVKQRHHPQVAGPALKPHDFLKGNGNPDGADHESLRGVADERRKDMGGGEVPERRGRQYREGQRDSEYGGRIVSGQKAGKPRVNRGKGRIHGKIAKRQEYLVGQALHQGKGHGQRHIEAGKRAGIEELLQPIAKFMGNH